MAKFLLSIKGGVVKNFSVLFLLVSAVIFFGFTQGDDKKTVRKISANDHYQYIAANRCLVWFSNNGDGSHDPNTGGGGFIWPEPKGTRSLIYEDGILFGGKVGTEIRVNGNTHRQGMQAGKILSSGIADDPSLEKYRVYKIKKNWEELPFGAERSQIEKDWNEWPVENGAPWIDKNYDGVFTKGIDEPEQIGDETLWFVMNDFDINRSTFFLTSYPLYLEVQVTVFAFNNKNSFMSDMIFKKYKFINKGDKTIRDMYISQWTDDDLGGADDDGIGCDTTLQMGYTWNGDSYDEIYNDGAPPAVAHLLLQGPIINSIASDSGKFDGQWIKGKTNLDMNSFYLLLPSYPPPQGDPTQPQEYYNYMKGLQWDGSDVIDPHTNLKTTFMFPGDPVTQSGWYYGPIGSPGGPAFGDVRYLLSTGPFNFAVGDTQEVIYATVAARGNSNLNSITRLRESARIAHLLYKNNFSFEAEIPSPELSASVLEREISLMWNSGVEDLVLNDPFIPDTIRYSLGDLTTTFAPVDKNFRFQAYKIYQYKDEFGTDPRLIAQFDINDSISDIYYYQDLLFNQIPDYSKAVLRLSNTGLKYFLHLNKDIFTNKYFNPGSDYYFGVSAVAFSRYSIPPVAESKHQIIKVTPGLPPIDHYYSMPANYTNKAVQTVGIADANISAVVFAPELITNDTYTLSFSASGNDLKYNLKNSTTNKDLLVNQIFNRSADTSFAKIVEGFFLKISDEGYDSIKQSRNKSLVKSVKEIRTANGELLDVPKNVLNEFNSTNKWKMVVDSSTSNPFFSLNWKEYAGEYDYEIRFTNSGSQAYYSKFYGINPFLKNDSLSPNKVPFEVWRTDQFGNSERCFIKYVDEDWNQDWNLKTNASSFETILVYKRPTDIYQEPLPPTSGTSASSNHFLRFSFSGEIPAEGTMIKISTWKSLKAGHEFSFQMKAPLTDDNYSAKNNLDKIFVFPNPYFGRESFEDTREFVTFTNLPHKAIIRIYSLGGTFVNKLEKDNSEQYLRWDLKNVDGYFVGSGVYLAYIDMPGVGKKIMKIAVIQENRFYLGY